MMQSQNNKKLSILINAYACSPYMGSEPGMAWNWCMNLANYCELHIITEGEFRENIEKELPTLPQGKNMHFYYNPVPEKVRKMCWNQGDWRFYKYYKKWQYKTYEIALGIIKEKHIDVLHQLNMIGFREPGYLWKIKSIPFVWGPVDAKRRFPTAYLTGMSTKEKMLMFLKNNITGLQLRYGKRIQNAVYRANIVVSASSESVKSFKKYFHIDSPLLNETGCKISSSNGIQCKNDDTLNLLWVGKLDVRKQLALALHAIAQLDDKNVLLHIVGAGNQMSYHKLAEQLEISSQCIWHGAISHEDVQYLMQKSDLFFFTSVAEGTPHVVLEAITNSLPVLCFDCCGQGDSVNEQVGLKIALSTPQQSVRDFVDKISYIQQHRDLLQKMSYNCKERQQELSWENKAKQMVSYYEQAIKKFAIH